MKRLLFLFILLSQAATGQIILKVGTDGYVTINGANYTRGYLGSRYLVIGTDSTLGINVNSSFPKVLYAPVHCTSYLDGDHSNTPFASMAALRTWMNAHFEFVDTSHGGGADSSIYATRNWTTSNFVSTIKNLNTQTNIIGYLYGNGDGLVTSGTPVTSITAGTGLTGGTITTSGTIALKQPFFDTSFSNFHSNGNDMDSAVITMPEAYTHCVVGIHSLSHPNSDPFIIEVLFAPAWRINGTMLVVYISANSVGNASPPGDNYLATVHLW